MWLNPGRLRHILPPRAYWEESQHLAEQERIFEPGWFLVDDHATLRCGQLAFGTRSERPRSLPAETLLLAERLFGAGWKQIGSWRIAHAANWKVPIENAVESYHVARVHPHSFGEVWCTSCSGGHQIGAGYTTYEDTEAAGSMAFRALMRALRDAPRYRYLHHHAFPSLTFAATDILSFVQGVYPTSPTTSESVVRAFLHEGDGSRGLLHKLLTRPSRMFVERILGEDDAIFPDIQAGLRASPHAGVLGACEERIYYFQEWLADQLA